MISEPSAVYIYIYTHRYWFFKGLGPSIAHGQGLVGMRGPQKFSLHRAYGRDTELDVEPVLLV